MGTLTWLLWELLTQVCDVKIYVTQLSFFHQVWDGPYGKFEVLQRTRHLLVLLLTSAVTPAATPDSFNGQACVRGCCTCLGCARGGFPGAQLRQKLWFAFLRSSRPLPGGRGGVWRTRMHVISAGGNHPTGHALSGALALFNSQRTCLSIAYFLPSTSVHKASSLSKCTSDD